MRFKLRSDLYILTDKNHLTLESLYRPSDTTAADRHMNDADNLRAGILDLLWDNGKVCCYSFIYFIEFNITYFGIHHSLRFMIGSSIPRVAVPYSLPQHFILSGVALSRTRLPMTTRKCLHFELLHLSIWC